jgi:hypothetical protein
LISHNQRPIAAKAQMARMREVRDYRSNAAAGPVTPFEWTLKRISSVNAAPEDERDDENHDEDDVG